MITVHLIQSIRNFLLI